MTVGELCAAMVFDVLISVLGARSKTKTIRKWSGEDN